MGSTAIATSAQPASIRDHEEALADEQRDDECHPRCGTPMAAMP